MFTAFIIGLCVAAAVAVSVGVAAAVSEDQEKRSEEKVRDHIKQWCKDNDYELSDDQIEQLVKDYSFQFDIGDWESWNRSFDDIHWDELNNWLDSQLSPVDELGFDSERPTEENLEQIAEEAEQQIIDEEKGLEELYETTYNDNLGLLDANNAQAMSLLDQTNAEITSLYDQALKRQVDAFQNELDYNNQSYRDMINQVLTNDAMAQESIAGSTRFELDRERRNAISRGASAAMRLVGNINTQLGLQNQAAQQSLDTSNQLAQMMLNQRQAGSSLRQNYVNALNNNAYAQAGQANNYMSGRLGQMNNYTNSRVGLASDRANALAGLRNGLTANAWAFGRDNRDAAYNDWHNSHQDWLDSVYEHYAGDDEAAQSYIKNHGSRKK